MTAPAPTDAGALREARKSAVKIVDSVCFDPVWGMRWPLIEAIEKGLLAARATTDADLAKAREEIAGLKAAVSSILPGKLCGEISGVPDESRTTISITFGQIRAARAALTHGGDRGEN